MKKILIISPHFPPVNSPDMHRVRLSVSYYAELGWEPVIVAVKPEYVEFSQDDCLLLSIPDGVRVIRINAVKASLTRRLGFSDLSIRSFFYYWKAINEILSKEQFDLIFFSTTCFPLLVLGHFWKKRHKIPYLIDMQDPWHSAYYLNKSRKERPPKFWLSYYIHKWLEAIAMKSVDGIMAVSESYIQDLTTRYPNIPIDHCNTITFGADKLDFEISKKQPSVKQSYFKPNNPDQINIVYVGAVGSIMKWTIEALMKAITIGLKQKKSLFTKCHFFFIGTNYARNGTGQPSVLPIAQSYHLDDCVFEQTDRISYYESLKVILEADILIMPGSDNPSYTASKLYPYILAQKPLLAIFHKDSSVVDILEKTNAGEIVSFSNSSNIEDISAEISTKLDEILSKIPFAPNTIWEEFDPYLAKRKTLEQINLFNKLVKN